MGFVQCASGHGRVKAMCLYQFAASRHGELAMRCVYLLEQQVCMKEWALVPALVPAYGLQAPCGAARSPLLVHGQVGTVLVLLQCVSHCWVCWLHAWVYVHQALLDCCRVTCIHGVEHHSRSQWQGDNARYCAKSDASPSRFMLVPAFSSAAYLSVWAAAHLLCLG